MGASTSHTGSGAGRWKSTSISASCPRFSFTRRPSACLERIAHAHLLNMYERVPLAQVTKIGSKQVCCAVATNTPSLPECAIEVRASDMLLARSVLDVTCCVNALNGLVANIARSDKLSLPVDRNGDVDMSVRDEYVTNHATTGLLLSSVTLLEHLVANLLAFCAGDDDVLEENGALRSWI